MEDYPRTLQELEERFATEQACGEYLARLRWPQGFVGPACEGAEAWSIGRGLWMCQILVGKIVPALPDVVRE